MTINLYLSCCKIQRHNALASSDIYPTWLAPSSQPDLDLGFQLLSLASFIVATVTWYHVQFIVEEVECNCGRNNINRDGMQWRNVSAVSFSAWAESYTLYSSLFFNSFTHSAAAWMMPGANIFFVFFFFFTSQTSHYSLIYLIPLSCPKS